jgi:hypothetical protein
MEEMQQNLSLFYACASEAEVHSFLDTLPDVDRRKVLKRADAARMKWSWLEPGKEVAFDLYKGQAERTEQEQVNTIYDPLFHFIASAQDTAHEAGKFFQLILGENHADRDAALVSILILFMAARLRIKELGIEACRRTINYKGEKIPGINDMQREIEALMKSGALPSEFHENSHQAGGLRKNSWFHLFLANQLGMRPFPNDPKFRYALITPQTHENLFSRREHHMARELPGKKTDLVSIYGSLHLKGLAARIQRNDFHTLFIDTTHIRSFYRGEDGTLLDASSENLAAARPLPLDSNQAKEWGETSVPDVVYVQVPGKGMERAEAALAMAEQADLVRGERCEQVWKGDRRVDLPRKPIRAAWSRSRNLGCRRR